MTPKSLQPPSDRRMQLALAGMALASILWAGMLLGVSFLATPAKFLAPSLSLPVALDVGRYTFEVFNRVEIGLSVAVVGLVLLGAASRWIYGVVALLCAIVAVEFGRLLPALDARTGMIIAGTPPPESSLHAAYIVLEVVKLIALLALGAASLGRLLRVGRPYAARPVSRTGWLARRMAPAPETPPRERAASFDNRRSKQ